MSGTAGHPLVVQLTAPPDESTLTAVSTLWPSFNAWGGGNGWHSIDIDSLAVAVFDHCVVRNANNGVQSKGCVTLRNTTIRKCGRIGLAAAKESALYARGLDIRQIGGGYETSIAVNILARATVRMDSTTVDSGDFGTLVYGNATLEASASQFTHADLQALYAFENATLIAKACTVSSLNSEAITVTTPTTALIDGCQVIGGNAGVRANGPFSLVVTNTTFANLGAEGIRAQNITSLTLTDNTFSNISGDGIYGINVWNAQIADNTVDGGSWHQAGCW